MSPKYVQPTLFGVAYASRLFRVIEGKSSYDDFIQNAGLNPDLGDDSYTSQLLAWLNSWGCRIAKEKFAGLKSNMRERFRDQELPSVDADIVGLEDSSLGQLIHVYEVLLGCGLGPTAASKALFAVRPKCSIPWDAPIREGFDLRADGSGYRKMLQLSRQEANHLVRDASKYGVTDIPTAVGSALHQGSLTKLLDEYHWVTITLRHRVPGFEDLEKWISWCPRPETLVSD